MEQQQQQQSLPLKSLHTGCMEMGAPVHLAPQQGTGPAGQELLLPLRKPLSRPAGWSPA